MRPAKYAIVVTGRYQSALDIGDATVWLRTNLADAKDKCLAVASSGGRAGIYKLVVMAVTKPKRKNNAKG